MLTEATVRALVGKIERSQAASAVRPPVLGVLVDGSDLATIRALAADWLAMRAVLAEMREELATHHTDFTPWIPQTMARLDAVLKGGE